MNGEQIFVDYYNILQVKSDCDPKKLELAYHRLAKLHHPDRTGAADTAKFDEVIKAYRVLRNPAKRAEYDLLHAKNTGQDNYTSESRNGSQLDDEAALADAEAHARILMFLYERRRENAQKAGVVAYFLQEMLKCSDDHFEFHKWYLKEKGFISTTEQGTLAITIQGVDHVISMSRTTRAEKLLIGQSSASKD